MSHLAYDLQLAEAMNDLQEQVKVEHLPAEKDETGVENMAAWQPDEIFQYLAGLYIKYIDIYRKLEECYDQIVHPQKRMFIKKALECTISRICDIKKDLITHNARPKSIYVHLDQLLFDLKYDPSIIEIPVPRYFKEDDRIPIDIEYKEKVEKDEGKKKKKKKKKKSKKKKKKTEEKPKDPPMPLHEKNCLMETLMMELNGHAEEENEVVADPFSPDISIFDAVRLIQKNDRGRQGRGRIMMIHKAYMENQIDNYMLNQRKLGKMAAKDPEIEKQEATVFLQRRMRGILARQQVEKIRDEEMEFLGMIRRKPQMNNWVDPEDAEKETRKKRKMVQEANMKNYEDAKDMIIDELDENEGTTIMEDMLKERRDWVTQFRKNQNGKIPDDLEGFHNRFKVETPLSPEEQAAKDAAEEAEAGAKKKGKKAAGGKGGAKGKGKKKKKGDDDDGKPAVVKIGPTETVQKFEDFYQKYNETWATRDESENYKQEYDGALAKVEVEPELKKRYKEEIDEMIKIELENMKLLSGVKQKKKKKGKKKAKKKKKGKGLKLPGYKLIKNKLVPDLLVELIQNNIVKKLPAQNLTDFMGEFNYIHSMLDNLKEPIYDPSMALIRQLVVEYIIFPLGSELVRSRMREKCTSYLFYGPPGTGKTLVVRACITETNSVLFDLSPMSIEDKYCQEKDQEKALVASTFVVAKHYQPSIIYIDECEKTWPAKKKGKKGKKKKKAKNSDGKNPARIKKPLAKWKKSAKFIDDKTRITIIGCTSYPEEGSKKDFKKFFDKQIYFPFPDYTTRRLMWTNFIERFRGRLKQDFPLSTLAHISAGYSAGSIKKTCEKVLTVHRVDHQDSRPLSIQEFIGPLSQCENTMNDQYEGYQAFTDWVTGQKAVREKMMKDDDEEGGDKKDKKGKGGGKKKGKK